MISEELIFIDSNHNKFVIAVEQEVQRGQIQQRAKEKRERFIQGPVQVEPQRPT